MKKFVDCVVAQNLEQAIKFLFAGGELWREHLEDCPEHGYGENGQGCDCCYKITDLADLLEMFKDGGLTENDKVHLVPFTELTTEQKLECALDLLGENDLSDFEAICRLMEQGECYDVAFEGVRQNG